MVIAPVTAPAGTVAVICVLLTIVKVAETPLANFTESIPVKFVPVMVTLAPTIPLVGLMPVIVGQSG